MLRFVLRGGFSVCLFIISFSSFSQTLSNTLLWRISGNNLSKPSYLYGTMHLQDKRLFQFGDSLYHALENTEGLAIEVDFKEAMDSIFRNGLQTAEEEIYLRNSKVKINRAKLGKTGDSLLRSMGIKGGVVTKKELKEIRDKRMSNVLKQGEMPTIMDAYLLGLAMRQGKWTGGIEDVADQLNLSDELGGALKPENVLMDDKIFKSSLEEMIALYLSENIVKLEEFSNGGFTQQDKDTMLINRNIKMAWRMDSLSHVRTMFFAVGAAHLAGDSGVIRLLREKGYRVEPVFSSSTLSADIYASKLKEIDWTNVVADDSAYTVKMTGRPSDYDLYGEAFKMKIFFDVTTMTFYMAGSVTGPKAGTGLLDTIAKNIIENMTGKATGAKIKKIQANGIEGREITANNGEGSYKTRVLLKDKTVFILVAGGMKETSIASPDATRFFESFKAGDNAGKPVGWATFSLPDKAFSVSMPGKPSLNKPDEKPDSEWKTVSYSSIDAPKGIYYMLQVGDINEGSYLDGDSAYFDRVENALRTEMDSNAVTERITIAGFPALQVSLYYKEADANYKIQHVIRGNRRHMLLAGAQKDVDLSAADPFFKSFELLPYPPTQITLQAKDGFSTNAYSQFVQTPADTNSNPLFYHADYYVTNKADIISYEVFKRTFSNTYWAEADSSYFENKVNGYKTDADTILKKSWVQNGAVKGIDVEIGMPGYNSIKKVRMLVNKDTLYTLFAMIPKQYINEPHHQQFFNDFKISNEAAPTIYIRKVPQLMLALQSNDSLIFEDAVENLDLVTFEKNDLPLLYNALLLNYRDSAEYYSVNQNLINIVTELADSTAETFVAVQYPLLKNEKENLRYDLLALLAKRKTSSSYSLLKQLLLQPLPSSGYVMALQHALDDSLELTTTLYPEILKQAADTSFGYTLITVTNELLDSALISKNMLMPYKNQLLAGAKHAATKINVDENEEWKLGAWCSLLGWLNLPQGNALLKESLRTKEVYLKQSVIVALLKNNIPVSPAEITKVAADKIQRGFFYEALQKIKKEALFPALYATQKSIAESDLYSYLSEEYEDFTLTYVGEKMEEYEGKKKLFHLFKVKMNYDDEEVKQTFLGVAGPYTPQSKEKIISSDAIGIYVDEEYMPAKTAKLLKVYLKQMEPTEK